jgi:hypothetical protein
MTKKENLEIPRTLSLENLCRFSSHISTVPDADEYVFDFGGKLWFKPFSMLFLLMTLNEFKRQRPNSKRRAENFKENTYASHMGFFNGFGLEHGNRPGEASGSETYVPITKLLVKDLLGKADATFQHVGDVIEEQSQEMAKLLCRKDGGDLFDTIAFSVREIIRNIVEHSEAPEVFMVGQYWPERHMVEIAIADAGIGIKNSLNRNPNTMVETDEEANKVALLPGVSGNINAGKGNQYDVWQNSGYGLYMAHRLCGLGGKFTIVSGDNALSIQNEQKAVNKARYSGTAVRLSISTKKLDHLQRSLANFRDEGARIAKYLKQAGKSGPSVASQMLARDFENYDH